MSIQWDVELKDYVSGPASAAAKAMGTASQQARILGGAMRTAQAALVKAVALGDLDGVRKASRNFHLLSESLGDLPPKAGLFNRTWEELQAQVSKRWRIEFDPIEAITAGISAVRALTGAVWDLGTSAIAASQSHEKMAAGLGAMNDAMHTGFDSGDQVIRTLNAMRSSVGMTTEQLAPLARQLMAAGIPAEQLQSHLTALATVKAINPEGADKYVALVEKLSLGAKVSSKDLIALQNSGVNVNAALKKIGYTGPDSFAKAAKAIASSTKQAKAFRDAIAVGITASGTQALAAQANDLGAQWAIAKEGVVQFFEAVDITPVTSAIKNFLAIFSEANPSGQVMKATFVAAFNAIYSAAGKAIEFMRVGFLNLIIAGLEVALFVRQHWAVLEPIFVAVAGAVGGLLVAAAAAAAVALWGMLTPVIIAAAPFLAFGAAVGLVVAAGYELVKFWPQISKFFTDLASGAWDAAVGFVDGLVNGIRSGIGRAVNAVRELGNEVVGGLKGLLGIHSPSAVLFELGSHTSAGFAGGIEAGSGDVQSASVGLSKAASGGASQAGGQGGGGGTTTVNLGGITIQIDGSHATTPGEMAHLVEDELMPLFERLALMVGSAPSAT